jgi:hypothetical protein
MTENLVDWPTVALPVPKSFTVRGGAIVCGGDRFSCQNQDGRHLSEHIHAPAPS